MADPSRHPSGDTSGLLGSLITTGTRKDTMSIGSNVWIEVTERETAVFGGAHSARWGRMSGCTAGYSANSIRHIA